MHTQIYSTAPPARFEIRRYHHSPQVINHPSCKLGSISPNQPPSTKTTPTMSAPRLIPGHLPRLLHDSLHIHSLLSDRIASSPKYHIGDIPGLLTQCTNTIVFVSNQLERSRKDPTMLQDDLHQLLARCVELLTYVGVRLDRLDPGREGDRWS